MRETWEIKKYFRSSIRRGTGGAYLLLRDNPDIDLSAEITKACVTNFAYDGQFESSRAPYLYKLILLSGKEEKIKAAILNSLTHEHRDTWTLIQLFELAKLYAHDGHGDAKSTIYSRFMKDPLMGSDWAGYSQIIELDGLDGLKFIASKMGEALQNNPDDLQDDGIIMHFQRENPGVNAWHELDEAGKDNSFIQTYIDNVREATENRRKSVSVKVTYSDVVEEVLLTKSRVRLLHRRWEKDELMLIAKRLITEKNRQNRSKLLLVFKKNKFPLNSDFILNIAKGKTTTDMSYIAVDALGYLKNDKVRNFAIDQILGTKKPQKYTKILKANYKKGDHQMLTDVIHNTNNEILLEMLVGNILDIYGFLNQCW